MATDYYGLGGGRWQTAQGVAGDPYYYGLNEAPNMIGGTKNISQPWHMQTGMQPGIAQGPQWTSLGEKFIPPKRLSTGHGVDADGNPVKFGLGNTQPNFMLGSADYQGRKWANELSGFGGVSLKCVLLCVLLSGAVAYGVSSYVKKGRIL